MSLSKERGNNNNGLHSWSSHIHIQVIKLSWIPFNFHQNLTEESDLIWHQNLQHSQTGIGIIRLRCTLLVTFQYVQALLVGRVRIRVVWGAEGATVRVSCPVSTVTRMLRPLRGSNPFWSRTSICMNMSAKGHMTFWHLMIEKSISVANDARQLYSQLCKNFTDLSLSYIICLHLM